MKFLTFLRTSLLPTLLLTGLAALAQAPGTGGPEPQDPAAVPLDGGAGLLLAGGVAYGLRRLRQRRTSH